MKWFDGSKISLMLVGFVVGLLVSGGGSAKADFTFGTPTNLGPPRPPTAQAISAKVKAYKSVKILKRNKISSDCGKLGCSFAEVEIILDGQLDLATISALPKAPGSNLKVLDDPKRAVVQLPVSQVKGLLEQGAEINVVRKSVLVERYKTQTLERLGEMAPPVYSEPHSYGQTDPQPHDECVNAIAVRESEPYEGSTFGATGHDESSCARNDYADVWHSLTPVSSSNYRISLCGSAFDTTLAVFNWCGGTELACNDDSCGYQSEVVVALNAGQTYIIRIAGYAGETGSYILLVERCMPLENDECVNATPIEQGVRYYGNTECAAGIDESSCGSNDYADVWHSFTPASSSNYRISLCGSAFDTTLAVFNWCGGTELACNDDSCGYQSEVVVALNAGQTYVIRIAGYAGETGSYILLVERCMPPENDECVNATPVEAGVRYCGTTGCAAGGDESSCGDNDTADVWHSFTPASSGNYRISLCGSAFDTTLAIFDACAGAELACNDDSCDFQSEVVVRLNARQTYMIRIAGYYGDRGAYTLIVEQCVPPENDDCTKAIPIEEEAAYHGNTSCAAGVDQSSCGEKDSSDVWHRFTPTTTGIVTLSLDGSEFDTTLAVFDQWAASELACNDDSCGDLQSEITMFMTAGSTYLVRVAGYQGARGDYTLVVTSNPPILPYEPSTPGPADGETNVPVNAVLSWSPSGAETQHGPRFPGTQEAKLNKSVAFSAKDTFTFKAIYGKDDRLEEYEVVDPDVLAAGDATVMLVSRSLMTDNGDGTFSVSGKTYAEWYQDLDPIDTGNPLCDDEPFRNQPAPGLASGFLVAPDIIATAGHAAWPDDCSDNAIVFGFVMRDADTPVLTIDQSEVYYCTEVIARQEGNPDWGLMRLDREVTGHKPLPVRHAGIVPDGEPLMAIGYPFGLPRKYAAGGTVSDNTASAYFEANLDTYEGSSGSVVLNPTTLRVEGIVYEGAVDFVEDDGCDRSHLCPDAGCPDWPHLESVSRATEFSPVLPSFDVYVGTDPNQLSSICSDAGVWSRDPGRLQTGTKYYWQVVSKNCYAQTEGPIWSFTTSTQSN